MAKKTDVGTLYGDVAEPTATERAEAARGGREQQLNASLRADQAGTPATALLHPFSYHQKVIRVWQAYETDPLFKRMIDRAVEFAINGSEWEVPAGSTDRSWLTRLNDWLKIASGPEREEEFWNAWAGSVGYGAPGVVNADVPGVLPGLDEVAKWCARHLLLSGMFVPHWEWGEYQHGKQKFVVPTRITCYPAAAITLLRKQSLFMEEDVYYRVPTAMLPVLKGKKGAPISVPVLEGQPIEAFGTTLAGTPGSIQLPAFGGDFTAVGQTEAVAIKFNFSPGDVVSFRRGQTTQTGQGVYPIVPFHALHPQFLIRQKLFASDLAILDGIINYLEVIKVGDKDHPPAPPKKNAKGQVIQDGTLTTVRKIVEDGRAGLTQRLYIPYYVDLSIKMPDTNVLVSEKKYVQSTLEILSGFGILFARAQGSRERMEQINITNFEEFLASLRAHVRAFVQMLAMRIVSMNRDRLKAVPSWSLLPLNTKSAAFMEQLFQLAKIGRVSLRTLLRYHGINDQVELRRIAAEIGADVDDMVEANTPITYIQRTVLPPDYGGENRDVNPGGAPAQAPAPGADTAVPAAGQPGRPKGSKNRRKR
jgi:hypothetical protein